MRITNLENRSKYRFIVYGSTAAGKGDPNSRDVITLPEYYRPKRECSLCISGFSLEQNCSHPLCFLPLQIYSASVHLDWANIGFVDFRLPI